ncbi:MAG: protease complex subunit PrcB family protein [Coleofasciculus chthonoplastes F3-SA18-01]|uniref:protease complex subunit PrcB family protein n=1 Tax=Coleofasciculus chthonoplastes TaxID=64178 RepID=UPI0032FA6C3F
MKKLLMIAASLFIISAESAQACSCMRATPEQHFESANAVFSGRVVNVLTPRRTSQRRQLSLPQKRVMFEVSEVWKGQERRRLMVMTSDSSASCGFNFTEGKSYLVYASRSDNRLTTSLCSGTKLLSQAQEDLRMLEDQETPSNTVAFETLEKSWNSGIAEPFETIIRDQGTWEQFFGNLHSIDIPTPSSLNVDFTENMVIGIGLGNQPSGGYSIEIKDIVMEDGKLVINAVEQQPGQNCLTTMAITQPYHLVTVEKSDLPVEFNRQTEIVNCE